MNEVDGMIFVYYPNATDSSYRMKFVELITCKNCIHYRHSEVANRKMCFRKDADGIPVCYDFLPDDWCKYGEMKGFGIEVSDAMSIIDKFNEVGNIHAISSSDIGEALQRSAAAEEVTKDKS